MVTTRIKPYNEIVSEDPNAQTYTLSPIVPAPQSTGHVPRKPLSASSPPFSLGCKRAGNATGFRRWQEEILAYFSGLVGGPEYIHEDEGWRLAYSAAKGERTCLLQTASTRSPQWQVGP